MLFSATMPGEVVTLARRHLQQPMHVRAEQHDEPEHVPLTQQYVFRAHQMDKIEMLARVLQAQGRGLTMVFCRTKRTADQVAEALTTRGFAAAAVHGDLGQAQRERALRAFRNGKVDVLVATDVAARGLDVEDVTHVVNYECPEDAKAYLHRIGRTGRAGRAGVAVTFVDWSDLQRWKLINETLGLGLADPPETYSTSEHLFTALDIPAEPAAGCPGRSATGRAWRPRRSRIWGRPGAPGPSRAAARPGQGLVAADAAPPGAAARRGRRARMVTTHALTGNAPPDGAAPGSGAGPERDRRCPRRVPLWPRTATPLAAPTPPAAAHRRHRLARNLARERHDADGGQAADGRAPHLTPGPKLSEPA